MVRLNQHLYKLGQRMNRFHPYINSGGCCVYASILGEELLKRGIDARIIVGASGANHLIQHIGKASCLNEVRDRIGPTALQENWQENGVHFNHVGLEFKSPDDGEWYHCDSDNVAPQDWCLGTWEIYKGWLSVEDGKILAAFPDGWNTAFDRKTIPLVKQMIRRAMKRYDLLVAREDRIKKYMNQQPEGAQA